MSSGQHKRVVGAISASIFMCSSVTAFAWDEPANINLAVASNFYGVPPSNSAITDLISAFQALNPGWTVTVVDNGATATLESNIINGNTAGVDLFLAADAKSGEIVILALVHARHFGRFSAHQSAARLHAALDDTRDDPLSNIDIEFAGREVIEKI